MTKEELIICLRELIAAASIVQQKSLDDSPVRPIESYSRTGYKHSMQFHHSIRFIADLLDMNEKITTRDHSEEYYEIGIMFEGWYLYELEDKDA